MWYADRGERTAAGFLREVERGLALIAESPDLWSLYELGTRRYLLRRFPYAIIYERWQERLIILALAHHRRRPSYWAGRRPL